MSDSLSSNSALNDISEERCAEWKDACPGKPSPWRCALQTTFGCCSGRGHARDAAGRAATARDQPRDLAVYGALHSVTARTCPITDSCVARSFMAFVREVLAITVATVDDSSADATPPLRSADGQERGQQDRPRAAGPVLRAYVAASAAASWVLSVTAAGDGRGRACNRSRCNAGRCSDSTGCHW